MLVEVLVVLALLCVLERTLRGDYQRLVRMRTRFALFKLRDQHRSLALCGEAGFDDLFDTMDSTFSKTIRSLKRINIWEATGLVLSENHLAYEHIWNSFRSELDRRGTPGQQQIFRCYHDLLVTYLQERHWFMTSCTLWFYRTLDVAARGSSVIARMLRHWLPFLGGPKGSGSSLIAPGLAEKSLAWCQRFKEQQVMALASSHRMSNFGRLAT